MEGENQDELRPVSQLASRFPSLRRLKSTEPYQHQSLSASQSDEEAETTFAVSYDDGPEYHVGHYESGSTDTSQRHSQTSFVPSFRTRDSRVFSDEHEASDLLANQRLLAEGYMNNDSNDPYSDHPTPAYHLYSQETLATNNYSNDCSNEKGAQSMNGSQRPMSSHSHQSWCTCDDDHGHVRSERKNQDVDIEAQKEPSTPTAIPFLQESRDEKKGPPAGGKPGPAGPPGGGPPQLPPFPPGFPDEFKVRRRFE